MMGKIDSSGELAKFISKEKKKKNLMNFYQKKMNG